MTPELIGQAKDFLMRPQSDRKGGCIGVLGDLALDRFIFGSVDRISPEAPVPVLFVERRFDKPGCAANVCLNLGALKESLKLSLEVFGVVGRDAAGAELLAQLKGLGRGVELMVIQDEGRPTTLKTRYLAGAQHQLLRVDEEKCLPLSPQLEDSLLEKLDTLLPKLDALVVQDYAKGLLSERLLEKVFAKCRKHSVKSLVDPNRNTPGSYYQGAYLITPNVAEAEVLLGRSLQKGMDDEVIEKACQDLKSRLGLSMVMITRSHHGITLLDESSQIHHFPAIARAVFDVTGAGDTVVAVFAAALVSGATLPVACVLATAAASVVVAKVGTATASSEEILEELDHVLASSIVTQAEK